MTMLRKTGALIRGKLTGNHVFFAGLCGVTLGFVPGFVQAPGLVLALLTIALVVDCNLILVMLTAAFAKLLSIPLLSVSFAVGQFLLDGPGEPMFRAMINAPVIAWFGLEYYATTGSLLVGLVLGGCWGVVLRKAFAKLHCKGTQTEGSSGVYGKRSPMRLLRWAIIGGSSDKSGRELIGQRQSGMPLRALGVVAVLLAVVGAWSLQSYLGGTVLRSALRSGLEYGNGATVDLAGLTLDLQAGQVILDGLAIADPNDLQSDLFRADSLQIALGATALLRRRLVIDNITSLAAKSGARREVPGVRIVDTRPLPVPPASEGEESKTLEDYLADAEMWTQRLQQVSRWIESLTGEEKTDSAQSPGRIEEQIRKVGLAGVVAQHLIEGAPLLLVRKLVIEDVSLADGGAIDIRGSNLSTNPRLVAGATELSIQSRDKLFGVDFKLNDGELAGKFFRNRLSVDEIASQLKVSGQPPMRGGTMDVSLEGNLEPRGVSGVWLDLPLNVTLRDATLSISGMRETKVERLDLPLGLRGPLAAPRITLDDAALIDALVASGKQEFANQLSDRAGKLLDKKLPGGLFGGKKKK